MKAGEFRPRFRIPDGPGGRPQVYFCGNSLGLMSDAARAAVEKELGRWARLGVAGHFDGELAWMPYHRHLTANLAELAGARPEEVVAMNSLTVNLHLMMVSLFRPAGSRRKILIEQAAFPSDRHAVSSQLRFHGLDPDEDLIEVEPEADGLIPDDKVVDLIRRRGEEIALVLWPGVQYATGQWFDLGAICRAGREAGCTVGLDLAHAIGNVPLELHDWGPDFAVWCSYKYLNAGPGAVGGLFVHDRHAHFAGPRFAGWWGHEEQSRFRMGPEFTPMAGAEGWQVSNPPILAMAPLKASLELFVEAGMERLRAASVEMTGALARRIDAELDGAIGIVTPREPDRRGCQLSLQVTAGREAGRALHRALEARGVVTDWREPDIIRVAPVPLYNTAEEVDGFVEMVGELV